MSYGFIYKIQNKLNNKLYVGLHKGVFGTDNYFGSGLALRGAIEKYGKENFTMYFVCECGSRDELVAKEIETIKKLNSKYPNGYNLTSGGDGLLDPSEHVKKKIRDGYARWLNTEEGKEHIERIRVSAREGVLGRRFVNNGEVQLMVKKDEFNDFLVAGWFEGMLPMKQSQRDSISKSLMGKKASDESKQRHSDSLRSKWDDGSYTGNRGLIFINNGIVNRQVPKDTILEDGWSYGMKTKKKYAKYNRTAPAWNKGISMATRQAK